MQVQFCLSFAPLVDIGKRSVREDTVSRDRLTGASHGAGMGWELSSLFPVLVRTLMMP